MKSLIIILIKEYKVKVSTETRLACHFDKGTKVIQIHPMNVALKIYLLKNELKRAH